MNLQTPPMKISHFLLTLGALSIAACGGGGNQGPEGMPDGGTDSDAASADGPTSNDAVEDACAILAPKIADCAGQAFSVSQCVQIYAQGVERGCDPDHLEAFLAFTSGGGEFVCDDPVGVGQDDLFPNSNDQSVILGAFCAITVQSPSCRSISCNTGSDCPGFPNTGSCNGRTDACFETDGYCPALPCNTGSDCPGFPDSASCNGALNTCIFE